MGSRRDNVVLVVTIQQPDGLRVELIGQSFSFCNDAPVLPMSEGLKQEENGIAWVAGVPDYLLGLPSTPGVVCVL